jgi:diguanylate cyclase (GGDEF)-like protein
VSAADLPVYQRFIQSEFRLFAIITGSLYALLTLIDGTLQHGYVIGLLSFPLVAGYPLLAGLRAPAIWQGVSLYAALCMEAYGLTALRVETPQLLTELIILWAPIPIVGIALPPLVNSLGFGFFIVLIAVFSRFDADIMVILGMVALLALLAQTLIDDILRKLWSTNRKVAEMAALDPMTGIFNRRLFTDLGTRAFTAANRHQRPISVLTLDIDHFKSVNDTYGHALGDQVIRMVADVFSRSLREADIYGRIGGEEFAAVLPETDSNRASEIAERVRQAVESGRVMLDGGRALKVTISVGVTTATGTGGGLLDALADADKALYAAKDGGRNQVVIAA